ncbi:MAG: hypothetical protein KDK62_06445 [Chlamydiia bacterium]|nr:hypothetical protein [Chlamydiia bacterium]
MDPIRIQNFTWFKAVPCLEERVLSDVHSVVVHSAAVHSVVVHSGPFVHLSIPVHSSIRPLVHLSTQIHLSHWALNHNYVKIPLKKGENPMDAALASPLSSSISTHSVPPVTYTTEQIMNCADHLCTQINNQPSFRQPLSYFTWYNITAITVGVAAAVGVVAACVFGQLYLGLGLIGVAGIAFEEAVRSAMGRHQIKGDILNIRNCSCDLYSSASSFNASFDTNSEFTPSPSQRVKDALDKINNPYTLFPTGADESKLTELRNALACYKSALDRNDTNLDGVQNRAINAYKAYGEQLVDLYNKKVASLGYKEAVSFTLPPPAVSP